METLYLYDLEGNEPVSLIFNRKAKSVLSSSATSTDTDLYIRRADYSNFIGRGASGDHFYAVLRDATKKEIVKVNVTGSSADAGLQVERGQQGTSAVAWPSGSLIYQDITASDLDGVLQKAVFRTVDYNPNGVLTPEYFGEKVYGDGGFWWKSTSATETVWKLICGDLITEEPQFSPSSGNQLNGASATLSCETPGAKIYYTTDGSNPTTDSTQYSSAISLDDNSETTIKAFAVDSDDGYSPSATVEKIYTTSVMAETQEIILSTEPGNYPEASIEISGSYIFVAEGYWDGDKTVKLSVFEDTGTNVSIVDSISLLIEYEGGYSYNTIVRVSDSYIYVLSYGMTMRFTFDGSELIYDGYVSYAENYYSMDNGIAFYDDKIYWQTGSGVTVATESGMGVGRSTITGSYIGSTIGVRSVFSSYGSTIFAASEYGSLIAINGNTDSVIIKKSTGVNPYTGSPWRFQDSGYLYVYYSIYGVRIYQYTGSDFILVDSYGGSSPYTVPFIMAVKDGWMLYNEAPTYEENDIHICYFDGTNISLISKYHLEYELQEDPFVYTRETVRAAALSGTRSYICFYTTRDGEKTLSLKIFDFLGG